MGESSSRVGENLGAFERIWWRRLAFSHITNICYMSYAVLLLACTHTHVCVLCVVCCVLCVVLCVCVCVCKYVFANICT